MTDITITRDTQGAKSRYVAKKAGFAGEGILTISIVSEQLVIADHTSTSDDLRGQGVGKALVERLIEDAHKEGRKVLPLCPFVRSYFSRHPDDVADIFSK
jgi:predicted GNAT family acetyltransferase